MRTQNHTPVRNGNGHNGAAGNGHSLGAKLAAAATAALGAVMTRGYNWLTLSIDHVSSLLDPIIANEVQFAALADIPADQDPGNAGNASVREGEVLLTILEAADAVPSAFGVHKRDNTLVRWDTTQLRADVKRFLLLRRAAQSSYIEKCNAAARVLAARLRAEILPKYENARKMAPHNELLADALDEAMKYFGHPAEAKKAIGLAQAKQQKRATTQQRRAAIDEAQQARLAKRQAENQARAQKQAAVEQLRTLRGKAKK